MASPDRLLTIAQVAERLGTSEKAIRNLVWAADHGLPHGPCPPISRLGRRLVCSERAFDRWLAETLRPVEQAAS